MTTHTQPIPSTNESIALWNDHVRPAGWQNPEPRKCYHLVVLGGGPAGLVTAAAAAGLGADVALVEKNRLGGDCLNAGCVPSKSLLASSARHILSLDDDTNRLAFSAAMEQMRAQRARLAVHDSADRFRALGVDVFRGMGVFTDRHTVTVADQRLNFKKAVIATGARAALPPICGLQDIEPLTNENVFDLTERPGRLAVIGAGPIGCELALFFARFGTKVTLYEVAPRILSRDDSEGAALIQEALIKAGIQIITGASIHSVKRQGEKVQLDCRESGDVKPASFDQVLAGAGRLPNVSDLGLEDIGITFDPRQGIVVDEYLRTTQSHIFAAGDVSTPWRFTHAADFAARVVVRNALFPGKQKFSTRVIPWCTYTNPELAQVGVTEADAQKANLSIETYRKDFSGIDRAVLECDEQGFVKIHVQKGTDRIVGATIAGRAAGEMIGYIAQAMTLNQGLGTFSRVMLPYPTRSEIFRQLGDAWNRKRLKPWTKKILSAWFRFTG